MHLIDRIFLSSCLGLPCLTRAQTFRHLNDEGGLVQQCVLAIAQDKMGFMWLGGRFGLSRWDGANFREYPSKEEDSTTLCDEDVTAMVCTPRNELWVGTSHGLCKYDEETEVFTRFRRGVLAAENIISLYEDREDNLWVGTWNGLFRMDGRHPGEFVQVEPLGGPEPPTGSKGAGSGKQTVDGKLAVSGGERLVNFRSVYEDSRGRIWAGCAAGLIRLDPVAGRYRFVVFPSPTGGVRSIWENPRAPGSIWAGTTSAGVLSFDAGTGATHVVLSADGIRRGIPDNTVRALCPDDRGRLWIGTQDGVSIYDPVSGRSLICQHVPGDAGSLSQNGIFSIFKDAEGSMWVGTYYGSANVAFSHSTDFTLYHEDRDGSGISNDVITCMAGDGRGKLWLGTDGGGIDYFDRSEGKFTAYKHSDTDPASIGTNVVKAVCLDRDGNLWVGTHGAGLNVKRGTRFRRVLKDTVVAEVRCLLEDREGRFWVGASDRLRVYTRRGRDLFPYTGVTNVGNFHDTSSASLLYEDKEGNLWMAAGNKLFVLKHGQAAFTRFSPGPDSLFPTKFQCIFEDHRGQIWFGSLKGGLVQYDRATGRTIHHGQKEGLPDNNVMGMAEDDDGRLWLATDVGLSCLNPTTNLIRNFTVSDGLPSGGFYSNSVYKDSIGELFFGSYNGFVSFKPANVDINPNVTTPKFTSLDVSNKPVAIGASDGLLQRSMVYQDHLSLGYDQDEFTIHFALLNFIKSEKNRYAYKMVGIDRDWKEVAVTSATYSGLPDGHYVFMVKAANNDGTWGKPAMLPVTIRPPFWKTWWAYCLYGLAAATLLFFIMRYLLLRERVRQEGALNQAKLNFFTNISHEIRTHLALISGPVEKMLLRQRDDEDRRQLDYIKRNSESLLQLVRELMDFRKAESGHLSLRVFKGDVVSFAREIVGRFEPMATDRNIRMSFVSSAESIPLPFDAEQLEKVMVNLLTNAFKFTADGGAIDMLIEENRSDVEIRVLDNGKGIAPENLSRLFTNYYQEYEYGVRNTGYGIGLALAKTIVELHKGQLKVESKPGVLTCFSISLPKKSPSMSPVAPEPREGLLQKPELSTPAEEVPADKKYTVLIVEDNAEMRSFLQSALDDQYQVIQAPDGLKGWETAVEELPDLVISDVMMPGMDGFSLCGKLKSDTRTSHIPAILLTARSSTADQISGLEMGADIYLAKPFSIHILRLHLRNLLAMREKLRKRYVREIGAPSVDSTDRTLDDEFMKKALEFIGEKMDDPEFGVPMLATHMLMSQPILYKKIKALTGMSVNDFIKSVRLKKAARLLLDKQHTVIEVVYMVGYSDRKHFTKEFKKMFDVTPGEYGKG